MPTFAPPSTPTDEVSSPGRSSRQSNISFKSAQGFEESATGPDMDNLNIGSDFMAAGVSNQESIPQEGTQTDMQIMFEEMRRRDTEHRREMNILQSQMSQMMSVMQKRSQSDEQVPLEPRPGRQSELREPLNKDKPLKWPEAYDHKDRSKWATTHGILRYIYRRDVEERHMLEPSDFFMQLYSHAVTGTAQDMITGQFQDMLANDLIWDALGLLQAMDDTYRDRNEEQSAAMLFHACRQFRDESLSSYLPRFQQLLTRSPSSTVDNKNKMYQLRNSLNKMTRNHMIGRSQQKTFRELVQDLSLLGSEIEDVGIERTKQYLLGQAGYFDDGTRGIAGGRLLGGSSQGTPYHPPANENINSKDHDGDTRMTGVNKVRAKWVSRTELSQRRADGACLRCGRKGHMISNCHLLPAKRPETTVQSVSIDGDSTCVKEANEVEDEGLKG